MGVLDTLFRSTRLSRAAELSREPKYMEVDWARESPESRGFLRVVNLNDYADVEVVLDYLRDRKNIVILKVKPRLVQEKMELKRALKRIQRTCQAIGGDIVGVREDIIVITPPEFQIWRGPQPEVAATAATESGEEPKVA